MQVSPYLVVIIASWVVAQGLKYVIVAAKHRSFDHLRQLYLSGNMPSAHSASTVALASLVGMHEGTDTAVFAVALLFAAVVMYDAMILRRSVGEQGVAIREMIRHAKVQKNIALPRAARGHTPLEVLVGAALGLTIACIVFFATK